MNIFPMIYKDSYDLLIKLIHANANRTLFHSVYSFKGQVYVKKRANSNGVLISHINELGVILNQ